jgi:hypothetical protein
MAEGMHDSAQIHFIRAVRNVVNPLARFPLSPDLNPLDIYLWGHLKSLL